MTDPSITEPEEPQSVPAEPSPVAEPEPVEAPPAEPVPEPSVPAEVAAAGSDLSDEAKSTITSNVASGSITPANESEMAAKVADLHGHPFDSVRNYIRRAFAELRGQIPPGGQE